MLEFLEPDMPLPQALQSVIKRPGMFFHPLEFDVAAAYFLGFDLANDNLAFVGLREWLVTRVGHGSNLVWPELVLHAAFPDVASPRDGLLRSGGQEHAVKTLFRLLEEYGREREGPDGIRRIYVKYQRWLERQSWYDPSSPHYIAPDNDE